MKRRFKWLWIPVVFLLLLVAAAYAVDRLLLAPTCPACHTDMTKNLPLFDPSREGLVRIRASGMEFRARVAGFQQSRGRGRDPAPWISGDVDHVGAPAGQIGQSWFPCRRL